MCSLFLLGFRLLSYSLFLWIILSWIQVSNDHPIGQVKMILDRFYGRLLEPIRSRIGPLRIGMAGIDLSPNRFDIRYKLFTTNYLKIRLLIF
jgi:YGGT family.